MAAILNFFHTLKQKSHEDVFACPENTCKSIEEVNKLSWHPNTLQMLLFQS